MADLLLTAARVVLAAVAALTALAVGGGAGLAVAVTYGAVACVWAVAAVVVALIVTTGVHISAAPKVTTDG